MYYWLTFMNPVRFMNFRHFFCFDFETNFTGVFFHDSNHFLTFYLLWTLSQVRICRPSSSVLLPFSWKMRNVLNRIKNQFSNFYLSNYRENSSKIGVIFSTKMTKYDHNCISFLTRDRAKNLRRKEKYTIAIQIPNEMIG